MKINPKLMTISVLSSFIVLLLSGCASSSSVEEQTKLIEYEKCLETELRKWILQGENEGWSQSTLNWLEDSWEKDKKVLSDFFIEACQKRRP